MDDLVPIFVVGFVMLCVYKVFELLVRKRERELFIEKLAFSGESEEDKGKRSKLQFPFAAANDFGFWPLRASLLLVGIGTGCLLAFFIQIIYFNGSPVQSFREWFNQFDGLIALANFACITLFGGIGLLIAFLIEQKKKALKDS